MSPQSTPIQPLSVEKAQAKLLSEARALIEISQNFTNIAAGVHVEAEKDEARSKLQSVINGLQYLKDRI